MSERIRLLLNISDLGGGGAERQMSLLARHISRDLFEPRLLLWRENDRYPVPEDVPVHRIRKTRPWHVFGAVAATRRLIDELEPDLVFSQLHYVNMVTGTALAGSRHRPTWVCRQSNDPRREMRGVFAHWARRALSRADQVICCSQGVARATHEHLRVEEDCISTLDNVADVAAIDELSRAVLPFERPEGRFVIVHAGRLFHQKNQGLLLRAFAAMEDKHAELWVLGEGELGDSLKSQAEQLGVSQRVRWLGFQKNPFPFFRTADCSVLSSDYEGLPNVIIESMLCGTPAIATRCPFGPEELIEDGVTGKLVEVGDAQALAGALDTFQKHPGLVHQLGQAARSAAAERFATAKTIGAYEALFETTLNQQRSL